MYRPIALHLLLIALTLSADPKTDNPPKATPTGELYQLSLDLIPELVRQHNPDLANARALVMEIEARAGMAGLRDNPEIVTSFQNDPRFREVGGRIGVIQSFPVTERLFHEKRVSKAEVNIAAGEVASVEQRLIGQANLLLVRLLALRQHESLHDAHLELADELADYTAMAASKGEGSQLDATQSRLDAEQLKLELRQIDLEATRLQSELRTLLGLPSTARIEVGGKLREATFTPFPKVVPENRADHQTLTLLIEAASEATELEKARRWQDIAVGLFTEVSREEDAPIGLEREHRIGFSLSIPLPLWNRNEGAIKSSEIRTSRLKQSLEALKIRIANEASSAHDDLMRQLRLAEDIQENLIPKAEAQVDKTLAAYRLGQISLEPVLRAREQHINLRAAHLHALRDYNLAHARLMNALGNTRWNSKP